MGRLFAGRAHLLVDVLREADDILLIQGAMDRIPVP